MTFFQYLKLTLRANNGFGGISLNEHYKIFKEWNVQLKSKKQPLDLELPWITVYAKNYILNYFKYREKKNLKIFEFGSGGSSLFFLNFASEVASAEHNEQWFKLIKETIKEKKINGWEGIFNKATQFDSTVDLTKLEASNPDHYYTTDPEFLQCSFKNYASSIDKFENNYFDVILIDGRSRPSCIKHSVNKLKSGGLLVLDNAERKYYLENDYINLKSFNLVLFIYGALICYPSFTQTNIYIKE